MYSILFDDAENRLCPLFFMQKLGYIMPFEEALQGLHTQLKLGGFPLEHTGLGLR